ncbi:hypothetical protein PAB09_04250 [Corynebacterium sp. SCR221107]|uniref:hypothetical protein n=1 Tax=Corynebacterium sp. SCR221107 TaxID=3017361 RepID=UPI0022EC7912|nr:hypothetical protein [Corynebacterium sp. SCR221107]WBT09535.1 hypothetical protein PAB09_04250 [Corynebacterium sp. SCR221107]
MTDGANSTVHGPRRGEAQLKVVAVALPLFAVIAIPFVVTSGVEAPRETGATPVIESTHTTPYINEDIELVTDTAPALHEPRINTDLNQISYINLGTGEHVATASERFARPALSLAKLYIADYVLDNGTESEKATAMEMIQDSSDAQAGVLFSKYPKAISATAEKYNLESTISYGKWGYSYTSTFDVVRFVSTLLREDPQSPILSAMDHASATAEDGTIQDFGTAQLSGVVGTKWGWSDDGTLHSSVSYGVDGDGNYYVAAAMIQGSEDELSEYALAQLGKQVD